MLSSLLPNVTVVCGLGFAAATALADARAVVKIDGFTTIDLGSTGGDFAGGGAVFTLQPGEAADFHFDWSVSVSDDGRAAAWDGIPNGAGLLRAPNACLPLQSPDCGFQPSGFEQARALVNVFFIDGRAFPGNPNNFDVQITGATRADVSTVADSLADTVTRSGTADIHIRNTSPAFSDTFAFDVVAAGWVVAAPVPEPATMALMLAGLGMVGLRVRRGHMATGR